MCEKEAVREKMALAFAPPVFSSIGEAADRNAGQDQDDVAFFSNNDVRSVSPIDAMLHGSYALRYFSASALKILLPQLMIISMDDGFRYQPIIDAIIGGAADSDSHWGRHISRFSREEKAALLAWFNLLERHEKYDPYLIQKAEEALGNL